VSILALQQRLVEVGRIRMGEKRTSQSGKQYPAKLATWRLTSPDRQRLDAVAALYGGTVRAWEDQHEIITDSDALDIALIPGQALSQHLEHWGQEKPKGPVLCLRRCDGERELLKDRPCPCQVEAGDDGDLLCKPTTHLMVMLRRVAGIGSWRLSTRGWYAAQELLGTAGLLEQLTARGQLVPARLRLDQRTVTKADGNKNFVVPTIDIDVALDDVFGGQALGVGGSRPLPDNSPMLEIEPARSAPFTPVPVEQLAAPPSVSTREQLAVSVPQRRARANAAEPIKATGLRPGGGAAPAAAASLGGSVGGTESPSTDGPVPPAAAASGVGVSGSDADGVSGERAPGNPADVGEGAEPDTTSADQGASDRPPAAPSPAVETLNDEGAQNLARRCADAGVGDDRREAFLYAFSDGRYRRGHDVPVAEMGDIVKMLHRVRRGDIVLHVDPDGAAHPRLLMPGVDYPDTRGDSPESSPDALPPPASIGWKATLANYKGIGEMKLLRKARDLADEHGYDRSLITSLDTIPEALNDELRGWLSEQAAA
jgi:hypothetical protein